jgi:hypothetical protein
MSRSIIPIPWSVRIVALYSSFVVFMLFMVWMAWGQDFDLVSEDYYEQELAFQDQIDMTDRATTAGQAWTIEQTGEGLTGRLNATTTKVQVHLFRPSDEDLDRNYTFTDAISIPASDLTPGKYIMKVQWTDAGKEYYQQQDLIVR